jgi:hypothetical protein
MQNASHPIALVGFATGSYHSVALAIKVYDATQKLTMVGISLKTDTHEVHPSE